MIKMALLSMKRVLLMVILVLGFAETGMSAENQDSSNGKSSNETKTRQFGFPSIQQQFPFVFAAVPRRTAVVAVPRQTAFPRFRLTLRVLALLSLLRNINGPTNSQNQQQSDWGPWSSWGSCNSCNAVQSRTRTCPVGSQCSGSGQETRPCSVGCSGWTYWSSCTSTCPGSVRVRVRTCQISDCQEVETKRCVVGIGSCETISCPARGTVTNGLVSCTNGDLEGSTCTVSCSPPYQPVGDAKSECIAPGVWNKSLPTCPAISCPARGTVTNGLVSCTNGDLEGSTCTVSCNPPSQPVGDAKSECIAPGVWNKSLPTCPDS